MLTGSLVAIATPMRTGGALDVPALGRLIDFHIENGTAGIVVVGTTGESPTVDVDEHCSLIKAAVEFARGRIAVIAGTGGNATSEAIALTEFAKKAGAQSGLSVVPYYNKPTQEGLYRHFRAIAEAVDIPLLLYNVPSRTVADLANDTIVRLAEVPNIVGIKEATSNAERVTELIARKPASFVVLSGDDSTALPYMMLGARGVISVTANIVPRAMHDLCAAALKADFPAAIDINNRLFPLHKSLFVESNPIPVKWALHRMGRIAEGIRLPLTPLDSRHHEALATALRGAGCIN